MLYEDGMTFSLSSGYTVSLQVEDLCGFGYDLYEFKLYRPGDDGRYIAMVEFEEAHMGSWGRWEQVSSSSKSLGNIDVDYPDDIRAEGEMLGVVAGWIEWETARKERVRIVEERVAEEKAAREKEENAKAKEAYDRLWAARTETCKWQLIGETVRVREQGKKVARLATIEVVNYGSVDQVRIKYASHRDDNCSRHIYDMKMIKVKEGKGYRVLWDDGDEDLPTYDRKSSY